MSFSEEQEAVLKAIADAALSARQGPQAPRRAPPAPPKPPLANRQYGRTSAPPSGGNGTFIFGRTKGQPLASATDADLASYRKFIQGLIDDPNKEQYYAINAAHLEEVDAEIQARGAT